MNSYSTWPEIKEATVAILPIGLLEQHGLHLPIGTDRIIAEAIAEGLVKELDGAFLLPALPFSASYEHAHFPGSVSLQSMTIIMVMRDIIESLERMGIQKCIVVNGHGGNMLLGNIAQEMNVDQPRLLVTPLRQHWENAFKKAGISTTISRDMHAGEAETSILLHLLGEKFIRTDRMMDIDSPQRDLLTAVGMKPYTETGAIGFPTRANAQKGEMLLQALINEIHRTAEAFLAL